MTRLALLAVVALGLLPAAAGAGRLTLPSPVTLDGVGGVRPGMGPAEVARRWGVRLRLDSSTGTTCQTAAIGTRGVHGYALFEHRRFGAVFFTRGVRTPSGIAIGTQERTLRRTYGTRLTVRPHEYVPGGHYYFLRRRSSPHWRIRFDTDAKGHVTQISFGGPAVAYVEGCA